MSFIAELKCAFRSFTRAQGLALTVTVTLALGIRARLAVRSAPRHLLPRVLREGAVIAVAGIVARVPGGIALRRVASALFGVVRLPGVLTIGCAATLLVTAAILTSLVPAARASRVDVLQALRSE